MKSSRGSTILTTPVIIALGIIMVSILVLMIVEIITPYMWYEKLSSASIKYIYVMEEFGYLTGKEASLLKEDLINQGFESDKIELKYTNNKVKYGEPISLEITYDYNLELPFMESQIIEMKVERYSVSKR